MRVGSIELPDELVDAHAEGRLVLFVGAGASVAEPTCLPTYRELVEKVAEQSERPVCGASLEQPDMVLSQLRSDGVDVHKRVHGLISNPPNRREPNELHQAVASLATASPQARIVTTNYDRCLSNCLPDGVDTYEAHALPEGDEFTGLVYLHGSVSLPPERLVVTADDLGRHYLVNRGGAARFLESMFRNLAVLFIGYSLRDTLMDYLVRGLTSDRIYVMTDKPQAPQWHELDITPIDFESHDILPGIVQDWADLSRMSMLDHQQRVRRIVSGSPPLTPDDDSYLHGIVSDTRRRGLFISQARGIDWLHWMSSKPAFKVLLNPFAPPECIDRDLAQWVADHYAANDDSTTQALDLIVNAGGTFNRALWMSIAQSLMRISGVRSVSMNRWLPFLAESTPRGGSDDPIMLLSLLLDGCDLEQDRATVLLLLDRILEPTVDMRRSHGDRVIVAEHMLDEIRPYISALALDLAPIIDRHLRRADYLQRAIQSPTEQYDSVTMQLIAQLGQDVSHVTDREFFDSISYSRKAIESHPRNMLPCGVDLLIDFARDVLELLVKRSPMIASGYLESWSRAESALLRRLTVHGWCERTDVTADEKLEWLTVGGWLDDRDAHHEVMRLIAEAVPSASEDALSGLIESVSSDPIDRRAFKRLGWIKQHAPKSSVAHQAFEVVKRSHPLWDMPDDADFWGGRIQSEHISRGPISEAQELHELIATEPTEAVALLERYSSVDDWEEPGWLSAIEALRATVEEHPDDGISVLEVIADGTEIDAAAGQGIAETVFDVLSRIEHSRSEIERLQAVLPRLWQTGLERFSPQSHVVSPSRWIDAAINHWAGKLTELWIAMIAAQWQHAGETWEGLSNITSTALKDLLADDSQPSHHAQVVLASKVAYLFAADERWCRDNLLPRFDSERDRLQAFRFWDGLFGSRQLSEDILQAGLLDCFVGFSCQLERLDNGTEDSGESVRSSYLSMAAVICLRSQINPLNDGWLMKWISRIDPEGRCEWARNVARMLSEMSVEVADVHWSRWMKRYWKSRAESIPLALTPNEASAMAEWTVLLGAGFTEAVELAVCTEASFVKDSRIPSMLLDRGQKGSDRSRSDHIAREPLVVRDLLGHLLSNSETMADDDGPWNITDAVEKLDRALDEDEMEPILNELLRLGHEEFVSWLQSRERTQLELLSPVGSPPG